MDVEQVKRFLGSYRDADGLWHNRYEIKNVTTVPQSFVDVDYISNAPDNVIEYRTRSSVGAEFRRILDTTKVGQIANMNSIFVVCTTEPLSNAFRRMIDGRIMSLPVYNESMKFVGFLDILDILSFLATKIGEDAQQIWSSWHTVEEISNYPCQNVVNYSNRNPACFEPADVNLQKVIDDIIPANVHRIAILEGGSVIGILSQTRIIDFLFQNNAFNEIGALGAMCIGDLRIGYRPVYKVSHLTKAIVAFQQMATYGTNYLAIVNNSGQLVGNLSASDLKEIGYDMHLYGRLFQTVEELKRIQNGGEVFLQNDNLEIYNIED